MVQHKEAGDLYVLFRMVRGSPPPEKGRTGAWIAGFDATRQEWIHEGANPPHLHQNRNPVAARVLGLCHPLNIELPQVGEQHKKSPGRKYRNLSGETSRKRRLSRLELDALMVVEVDVAFDHPIYFRKGNWFVAVETFCFKSREEIFCHCIVVRVSAF